MEKHGLVQNLTWPARVVVALALSMLASLALAPTAEAHSSPIYSIHHGRVVFTLTNAPEKLVLRGGSDHLDYEYTMDRRHGGEPVTGSIADLTGDVVVRAKGGDDTIEVSELDLPGDLSIVGGRGDDVVVFGDPAAGGSGPPVDIGDDLWLSTGSGADQINFWTSVGVADNLIVRTGRGDDEVAIGTTDSAGSARLVSARGRAVIATGSGADVVSGCCAAFGDDLRIRTGSGPDLVGLGAGGPGGVPQPFSIGDDLTISTGSGADEVVANGLIVDDDVRISTGSADDRVALLSGVTIRGHARLDGGRGSEDRLVEDGSTSYGAPPKITGFEIEERPPAGLPITGAAVPELAAFDDAMLSYMDERSIEAGLLAVMKDGVVVFERGYGWKDEANTTPIEPDSLMRIASVTKPITSAAINKLIGEGRLSADDRAFCPAGDHSTCWLDIEPFGTVDPRLSDVTVQHLLDHQSGWDPTRSGDPMFRTRDIAERLGVASPPAQQDIVRYMLGVPLDHPPGTTFAYSNFGYLVLGLIVEEVTGQDYTAYVQSEIFGPLGVASTEVELGATLPGARNPREPWYDSLHLGLSVFPPYDLVPRPDGAWPLEVFEAHGGLISTPRALLEFAQAYWFTGLPRQGDGQNWYAIGSLDGTYAMLRWRPDGINMAFIVNSRDQGPNHLEIKTALDEAADSIESWSSTGD